jgi:mono/diheme cytochrome c family protein
VSRTYARSGRTAAALAAAAGLVAGCGPTPQVGPELPAATTSASSFGAIVQDLLVPRCATSACHGGNPPAFAPPLDAADAWGALVGQPSGQGSELLVDPGAPERSTLVLKLRGTGSGALMPIGDAPLGEAEIAAIEAWIANGAPND